MMPGGLTEAKPATPEVQAMVDEVKSQLEEQTNDTYEEFEAVEYKTQVVAGINYFIKVRVGPDSYIHLKIFKPLPQQQQSIQLTGYEMNKSKDDELVKPDIEKQTGFIYEEFIAVIYKTQVVAGINYFIKVRVGLDNYIHVKIFKPLPEDKQPLQLLGYETNKSQDDELVYF